MPIGITPITERSEELRGGYEFSGTLLIGVGIGTMELKSLDILLDEDMR